MIQDYSRRFAAPIAIAIVAVVLALTLWPSPEAAPAARDTPWWCLVCGPAGTADQFQNLLLLLPLGLVLALAGWSFGRSTILLTALPLAIELAQGFLRHGRDAALGDVVANALGGMLGWWLGSGALRQVLTATWVAPLGLGLFVAQLLATTSLIGPSWTGPEPWRLRLAPVTATRPTYQGEISNFSLGGTTILAESPRPAQPLLEGSRNFAVTFTWHSPHPVGLTPIARLDDDRGWAIAAIDRRDTEIGLTLRTRAGALRWRTPTLVVPLPAGTADGDVIRASLALERGRAAATLTSGAEGSGLSLRYGAQHGWTLINPFTPLHRSATTWQLWTLAWLAGWGLVIGVASRHATRRWAWLVGALLMLTVVTAWSGARATLPELVALGIGWGLAQLSRIPLRRLPVSA